MKVIWVECPSCKYINTFEGIMRTKKIGDTFECRLCGKKNKITEDNAIWVE